MAGFVHHTHNAAARANNNNMYVEEAPSCYGYGLYYNHPGGGVQNIEAVPRHYAVFNGFGVSGNGHYSQPPVQHQMHYNRPYSSNRSNDGSGTWVHVGPNPYYMHRGSQTIQGDVVQRGTFNGRGMDARLRGHFSVSGDIK